MRTDSSDAVDEPDGAPVRGWSRIRGDRTVHLVAAAYLLVLLPYVVPVLDADGLRRFSEFYSLVPLLVATILAVQWRVRTFSDAVERSFWHLWSFALGLLLIVSFLYILAPEEIQSLRGGVTVDALYGGFYLCVILALQLRPDRGRTSPVDPAARTTEVAATVVFLSALFTYFVLVPGFLSRVEYDSWVPSLVMYDLLDAYLVANLLYLARTSRQASWRLTYGLLCLTATLWLITDLSEVLHYLDFVPFAVEQGRWWDWALYVPYGLITAEEGTWWNWAWYVPYGLIAAAVYARGGADPPDRGMATDASGAPEPSPLGRLVLYPLVLPVLHFGLELLDLLDPATEDARGLVVLVSLLLLLGLAFVDQRILERKNHVLAGLRRRAERQRTVLAAAVEQAVEGVLITDRRGVVEYANEAVRHVTGWAADEATGRLLSDVLALDQPGSGGGAVQEALSKGAVWKGRLSRRRPDGAFVEGEFTIAPVLSEEGEVEHFVAVGRDVSREAALEHRLRQAQKVEALGTLAGGIAHDFNNILGIIFGYADVLAEHLSGQPREHLDKIFTAAGRGRDLVRQILTFSRPSEPTRVVFDPVALVIETLSLLRAALPSTLAIEHAFTGGVPMIEGDEAQIQQVLMNLCTNASHAMAESGGVLSLTVDTVTLDRAQAESLGGAPEGRYVRFLVEDTGEGMDRETLERMYDPFFTTKEVGKGTGLGLSVVHGIVAAHGGWIRVRSEPGRGTTFEVLIPSADEVASAPPVERGAVRGGHSARILVVDDEPEMVELVRRFLERGGYHVTALTSSVEALDVLRASADTFDGVVTDQTMPGVTGIELAVHIRELRPDLPVMLITGFSEQATPERLASAGIDRILMKPFTADDLTRAVADLLSGSTEVNGIH